MMAVGHFTKMYDPGKDGLQLTDDSVMRVKDEVASNDPNVIFLYFPFQDDDMCLLETSLLHTVNVNDKVIIIAGTRHTQTWSDRVVDPMLCNRDLAFFCNCATTLEGLRLSAHERTPGIPRNVEYLGRVKDADVLGAIAEDLRLTRCAQVCFAGTTRSRTIDKVLEDQGL